MGEQSGVSIDKLTNAYVKIREKRAELSSKYKEEDENLVSQLDKIKKALLDYCKEHGVESVRTNAGLVYKSTRSRYWTSDGSLCISLYLSMRFLSSLTNDLIRLM